MVKNRLVLAFVGVCFFNASTVFASQQGMPKFEGFDENLGKNSENCNPNISENIARALQVSIYSLVAPEDCPVPDPKKKDAAGCPVPDPVKKPSEQ